MLVLAEAQVDTVHLHHIQYLVHSQSQLVLAEHLQHLPMEQREATLYLRLSLHQVVEQELAETVLSELVVLEERVAVLLQLVLVTLVVTHQ
jgi:hypothetical protein